MKDLNVLEYLNSFINLETRLKTVDYTSFKLERMASLLAALGNPESELNVIHVAGSKGKGSTCAMIAEILKEEGYRVGLYTSPHIYDFCERIRILDKGRLTSTHPIFTDVITHEELQSLLKEVYPAVEKVRLSQLREQLTWYEVVTAMAFVYFKKNNCDFVILETGLGGRLDATNLCPSKIAVITPLSFEHMHILGNTLPQIAKEKAAIIKSKDQKVIIAEQDDAAMEVVLERAKEFSIHPNVVQADVDVDQYQLGLRGCHQRSNVKTVLAVCEAVNSIGFKISEDSIREGLKNVKWPLRFEEVSQNPLIILDAAHNQASARALRLTLKEEGLDQNVILIVGFSDDKDISGIVKELQECAVRVIFTRAEHPRAIDFNENELKELFGNGVIERTQSIRQALESAQYQCDSNSVIVVTGSLFVAAEARKILFRH